MKNIMHITKMAAAIAILACATAALCACGSKEQAPNANHPTVSADSLEGYVTPDAADTDEYGGVINTDFVFDNRTLASDVAAACDTAAPTMTAKIVGDINFVSGGVVKTPEAWNVWDCMPTDNGDGTVTIALTYRYDLETYNARKAQMEERTKDICNAVNVTNDEKAKITLIHDWLRDNVTFTKDASVRYADNAIIDGSGNESAIASAFCWIAKKCGMSVAYTTGCNDAELLAWNFVRTSDGVVAVDVPLDILNNSTQWLMVSPEKMEEDHMTDVVRWCS